MGNGVVNVGNRRPLFPVQLVEKMSPATSKLHRACCWRWKGSNAGHDKGSGSSDTQKQRPQRGLAGVLYARIPHGRLGGGGLKAPSIVNFEPIAFGILSNSSL